ncbi:hypothetical protein [Paenibacillus xylaniclasticus]|uniref:hypothetical protein n=1 Tax=Paenibacillus xylaniclasticus TaxID=588083 RepID=UPI000FDA4F8B|nr:MULTISPECIES: hypothetical protein [Paenibacillus]GFN29769.1 hypothetical protein PCURB6_00290 [Paenibacillus curdlanolyticus]
MTNIRQLGCVHPEYEAADWRGRPMFIDLVWIRGQYRFALLCAKGRLRPVPSKTGTRIKRYMLIPFLTDYWGLL